MTLYKMRTLAALLILGAFGVSRSAEAQDPHVYVGGAGMVSTQDSHRQGTGPDLPTTGAGGTAVGVTLEAGAFLNRRVALGIEVSLPARFTALQETDYSRVFQQESRHRDLAITALLRGLAGPVGRVRVEVVGGGGFVQESTWQRRRDQAGPLPTYPPVFGPYSEEYSFDRWTVAGLVGADVDIAMTSHISLVPQVRVHFVQRSSDGSEQGWALGLSSVIWRPAIEIGRASCRERVYTIV
jgi:hypothetical protein